MIWKIEFFGGLGSVLLAGGAMLLLLAGAGCDRASGPVADVEGRRDYAAKGIVKVLEPDGRTVVIEHEAVSNYMPAMTMSFEVKEPKELSGLQPGDLISFRLVVGSHDGWIEGITKMSNATPAPERGAVVAPAAQIEVSRLVAPLEVGDRLPAYHLTNELGEAVDLGSLPGEVFAFTFFFTRCPFPNACPRLSDNFAGVQEKLAGMAGAPARWHLYSVSFDPANDTPAKLQEYGRRYRYDPARWSFLTGGLEEISELADQFGEEFQNNGQTISHTFRTVVVDGEGRVRRIIPGNAWTGDDLAGAMVEAAITH